MNKKPREAPSTLAESFSAEGSSPCPIPFTHDRLHEAHHWWHEMARYYHEPEPFRYRLGAFVQAARSVTFMLQSEKKAFMDFGWYGAWVKQSKEDAVLSWVNGARPTLVHRQALEPSSWMEFRCIDNPRRPPRTEDGEDDDDDPHPLQYRVNPFQCTHYHIFGKGDPWGTDHAHEYERHWEINSLPGRELLEACADVFDRLEALVADAHHRLGATTVSYRREGSPRSLPCMEDVSKHRIIRSTVKDGHEVWPEESQRFHDH